MFKDILEKFNKLMKFKAENFKAYKIKDSEQSIEVSELVIDAEVLISTPTGSNVAPDGDYILDDGSEIKVAGGKITDVVKEPAEEPEPVQELAKEEDAPVAEEDKSSKEAELQAKIDELTAELEKLKAGFASIPTKADLEKFQSDLTAELKKLENIPAELSKVDNRVELTDNPLDKYIKMVERNQKNK